MIDSDEMNGLNSPASKKMKLNVKISDRKSSKIVEEEDLSDMGVELLLPKDGTDKHFSNADDSENECPPTPESNQGTLMKTFDSPRVILSCLTPNIEATPEDFFRFRKRSLTKTSGKDLFSMLSDEIILLILKWLSKETLFNCAFVCKRWQRIVYDEKLWYKIELSSKVLQTDNLAHVLMRNPKLLRMSQSKIPNPIFRETENLMKNFVSKLEYLDLSMAVISQQDLAILLSKCRNLIKLSLEYCPCNTSVCRAIGCNPNLQVLNMALCSEIDADGIEAITTGCPRLVEWNLGWTNLPPLAVQVLCSTVNPKVEALNLSGAMKSISDTDIEKLVSRCNKLTQLDLSDCIDLTSNSIIAVAEHLPSLNHLSISRCYNIQPSCYWKLFMLKHLEFLNLFGLMQDKHLEKLEETAQPIQINKVKFSSIARPTVGVRRTSIWGLRVRH